MYRFSFECPGHRCAAPSEVCGQWGEKNLHTIKPYDGIPEINSHTSCNDYPAIEDSPGPGTGLAQRVSFWKSRGMTFRKKRKAPIIIRLAPASLTRNWKIGVMIMSPSMKSIKPTPAPDICNMWAFLRLSKYPYYIKIRKRDCFPAQGMASLGYWTIVL